MADNSSGPVCIKCKATSSLLWQKNQSGALLCLDCYSQERRTRSSRSPQRIASSTSTSSSESNSTSTSSSQSTTTTNATTTTTNLQAQSSEKSSSNKHHQTCTISTRRTTRARERNNRAKQQQQQQLHQQQQQQQQQQQVQQVQTVVSGSGSTPPSPATSTDGAVSGKEKVNSKPSSNNGAHDRGDNVNGSEEDPGKGTGRRSLKLKQGCRQPTKAPSPEAMIVTSDSIIHKGSTYEVGDIVSLMDRDGGIYYAMIRGFMQDQYADKYAVLTWLLPRYPNPTHFDPADFILGPEEDIPRSMEVIDFVSHSPQSRHFQTSYFHNLEQAELWKH